VEILEARLQGSKQKPSDGARLWEKTGDYWQSGGDFVEVIPFEILP
jgi:hypothetical protein